MKKTLEDIFVLVVAVALVVLAYGFVQFLKGE